ncbi:hypothetical protein TNCV_3119591 [Trichonephila clavipes]|uniref:Ig-like domain-containing protein n=1 Tax=Trichonephila clavipes TaxID=2585209 RepID=A0A8X7BHM1_TRICX|nr:hypothetical protein TNCV_3119591 [Trichonephila clavipes]
MVKISWSYSNETLPFGRVKSSSYPQGTQPPRMSDTRSSINVRQGTSAELTCVAQAYPLPNYKGFVRNKIDFKDQRFSKRTCYRKDADRAVANKSCEIS